MASGNDHDVAQLNSLIEATLDTAQSGRGRRGQGVQVLDAIYPACGATSRDCRTSSGPASRPMAAIPRKPGPRLVLPNDGSTD